MRLAFTQQGDDDKTVVIDSYKHMIILLEALMGRIESLKEKINNWNSNSKVNLNSNDSDGGGGGGLPPNKDDLVNSSSSNLGMSGESSGDDKEHDAALRFAKELRDHSFKYGKQEPTTEKAHGLLTGLIRDSGDDYDEECAAGAERAASRAEFDQSKNLVSQMRGAVQSEISVASSWRIEGTGELECVPIVSGGGGALLSSMCA